MGFGRGGRLSSGMWWDVLLSRLFPADENCMQEAGGDRLVPSNYWIANAADSSHM